MTDLKEYLEYLFQDAYVSTTKDILLTKKTSKELYDFKLLKDKKIRTQFRDKLVKKILAKNKDVRELLVKQFGANQNTVAREFFFLTFVQSTLPENIEKYTEKFMLRLYTELCEQHIRELLK